MKKVKRQRLSKRLREVFKRDRIEGSFLMISIHLRRKELCLKVR